MVPVKCTKKSSGMSIVTPKRRLAKRRYAKATACRLNELGRRGLVGVVTHKKAPSGGGPELVRGHSSVDRQGCTDDVGCLVRANEHDGICNFFGSADALVRNLCVEEICFVFLRLRKAIEHSRFHRTMANDVDTNACAGEFDGRRLRDAFHS